MAPSNIQQSLQRTQKQQQIRRKKMIIMVVIIIGLRQCSKTIKEPYNNAIFTGEAWTRHILNGNRLRAQAMFRLSTHVFDICSEELLSIDVEPASKLVSMDEQLAIFLYIVGQNATNRQTQDRFQHSGETISRIFHHVIDLFLQLLTKYIV
ncbi:hypothetical protein PtB15_3B573 [Puccinia triticina]|nr:hypothetical protein PtB15_3B573 [Puccinia triticina]